MIKIIKKGKDFLPLILILFFGFILTLKKEFSSLTIKGIEMYFAFVFPSLFPFFFISSFLCLFSGTKLLCKLLSPITTRLFKINGYGGYAYFMSLISGHPIGVSIICQLKNDKLLSSAESERGAILCSTSSPSYLISTVGAIMFNSTIFGVFLFLSHFLTSVIIGIIFSFYKPDKPTPLMDFSPKKTDNIFYESVFSCVNSSLFVGGVITLFYIFTEVIYSLGFFKPLVDLLNLVFNDENLSISIIFALFENSKGLKSLSLLGANRTTFMLSAFLSGFCGLSIIMQSVIYLKKAKIKIAPFLLSKVACAIINLFISFLFSLLLF